MNVMKAGLQLAHRLVAVSHGYAWECLTPEGGWGLHAILGEAKWKLRGIVNGIDVQEWNPKVDTFLKVSKRGRPTAGLPGYSHSGMGGQLQDFCSVCCADVLCQCRTNMLVLSALVVSSMLMAGPQ
jgi:hypothetical protein